MKILDLTTLGDFTAVKTESKRQTGSSARCDQPDGLHSVVQSNLLTGSDLTLQLI